MLRRSSTIGDRMKSQAVAVKVTKWQRFILEGLCRAAGTSQQLAERCRIILLSADGETNADQGNELGVDRQRIRRWRKRWAAAESMLAEAEEEEPTDKELQRLIARVLMDEARSGAPPTFSPEQVVAIISLACEAPSESGLPVSHWTPPELAREAIKRGIVRTISPRQVDRFLARRTCDRTTAVTG
jgi:putative transposase